jgi:hydrogenase 3 maturation protease
LLTADLQALLQPTATASLIITVGNTLRGDDAVGPYLSQQCERFKKNWQLIAAGEHPENIIDQAVALKPQKIVIIDAADFKGVPGEARLIRGEDIPETALSTHTFPLKVLAKILAQDTGAAVFFLGIQAASFKLGNPMAPEVRQTTDEIVALLNLTEKITNHNIE